MRATILFFAASIRDSGKLCTQLARSCELCSDAKAHSVYLPTLQRMQISFWKLANLPWSQLLFEIVDKTLDYLSMPMGRAIIMRKGNVEMAFSSWVKAHGVLH